LLKPNKLVFQYHDPVVHEPLHVPDKELYPERWQFYDTNTDNKFERPPETNFSEGIPYEKY